MRFDSLTAGGRNTWGSWWHKKRMAKPCVEPYRTKESSE